ncbi:MAG: bacillithiol biosynthesis cysteine-adding enzyme BshC [Flavobacteriaceae bacterium]|nr:bacillithiol biosynthesis cysteine-adding enzyme BshC [Flavobacteriaceae bacterium]
MVYKIDYSRLSVLNDLIRDYINEDDLVKSLYGLEPNIDSFAEQIKAKNISYTTEQRQVLTKVLHEQYIGVDKTQNTISNIDNLKLDNTYTITTGHQLNIFTGPVFFVYKIISVINLCNKLSVKYPEKNFVPLFWMASEDHDFEEINHIFTDKKHQWNRESEGCVGRLSLDGFDKVLKDLTDSFPDNEKAKRLSDIFSKAYDKENTLAKATMILVNELFGNKGLVILDADNIELKRQMKTVFENEIVNNYTYKEVTKTTESFKKKGYKIQVNPREINLFYIKGSIRERIIKTGDKYIVNNTSIYFTQEEILQELNDKPDNFSPNVMLRPVYQEKILPNLAYIGGAGELSYWLELKRVFEVNSIVFPIIILRDSVVMTNYKEKEKLEKLKLSYPDLFLDELPLANKVVKLHSNIDLDFRKEKLTIESIFDKMENIASRTDASFIGAVRAQKKKQLNGLANLEDRIFRAERFSIKDKTARVIKLKANMFPDGTLQERHYNFTKMYLEHGDKFFDYLYAELDCLDSRVKFVIID